MRKWLILLSAMSAFTAHGAPAWTWVDADGQVHFSDRPVPGAKQVELSGAQGFNAPARARPSAAAPEAPGAAASIYSTLEVMSPADQETLWNIGGNLTVQARVEPGLQPGHRFDLVLDGSRRNLNTGNPRFTVANVFRGTHTAQVVVIDSAGNEIASSPTRTFFVQQTSVQNPNAPLARSRATNGGN